MLACQAASAPTARLLEVMAGMAPAVTREAGEKDRAEVDGTGQVDLFQLGSWAVRSDVGFYLHAPGSRLSAKEKPKKNPHNLPVNPAQ